MFDKFKYRLLKKENIAIKLTQIRKCLKCIIIKLDVQGVHKITSEFTRHDLAKR